MRDPVDRLISLYNSHAHERFADRPQLFTRHMSFQRFLMEWIPQNRGQASPQIERILGDDGRPDVDYVVNFSAMNVQLSEIFAHLSLQDISDLPHANRSPSGMLREQLPAKLVDAIYEEYADDREMLLQRSGKHLRAAVGLEQVTVPSVSAPGDLPT
jgi:hypothetical protein